MSPGATSLVPAKLIIATYLRQSMNLATATAARLPWSILHSLRLKMIWRRCAKWQISVNVFSERRVPHFQPFPGFQNLLIKCGKAALFVLLAGFILCDSSDALGIVRAGQGGPPISFQ